MTVSTSHSHTNTAKDNEAVIEKSGKSLQKKKVSDTSTSRSSLLDTELFKVPDMTLSQQIFEWSTSRDPSILKQLMNKIKENDMVYFYQYLFQKDSTEKKVDQTQDLSNIDPKLYQMLQTKMEEKLKEFDEKLEDTKENLGESDVFELLVEKAIYLCRAAEKDRAITVLRLVEEKAATIGIKMDIVFAIIRVGFLYQDVDLINRNLEKASSYLEQGGDWDRRNRLRTYQAMNHFMHRNFSEATRLFCETLSTFTYTELISYQAFVKYTVICGLLSLTRFDFKTKILKSPEVLEVVSDIPHLYELAKSLYDCHYHEYFVHLSHLETLLKQDHWSCCHYRYIIRELRILSYSQLLESYSSVTLTAIAQSFGVTEEYIDKELFRWISSGRLNCVIDKISGTVKTTHRSSTKDAQYQELIKTGDALLNRLQKLGRVINV